MSHRGTQVRLGALTVSCSVSHPCQDGWGLQVLFAHRSDGCGFQLSPTHVESSTNSKDALRKPFDCVVVDEEPRVWICSISYLQLRA